MSAQIETLPGDQFERIRDIYMPLVAVDSDNDGSTDSYAVNVANLEETIAYTGSLEPYRLYDAGENFAKLIELFDKSDRAVMAKRDKFRVVLGDGRAFRGQRVRTDEGPILALRALPRVTPSLDDLRMYKCWKALLNSHSLLNGGLVLVVSTNGQGKTTTCSAVVKTRLETWGGLAIAVEDPPELPLKGWHGKGRCFQIGVDAEDEDAGMPGSGYARALLRALRLYASMPGGGSQLFVGEIRDAKTAYETLLAAGNGHLVIATLHAEDLPTAIMRFATLASAADDNPSANAVLTMLSKQLRGVFHQQLTFLDHGEGWGRGELRGSVLWVDKKDSRAQTEIKEGNYNALGVRSANQTTLLDESEQAEHANPGRLNLNALTDRLLNAS